MKTSLLLLLLLSNLIKIPASLVPYSGSSLVTSKDKRVGWTADWGMEPTTFEVKRAVRFTEKGTGHLSSFPNEVQWSLEALWLAEDAFLPLEFEKTVTTSDGKELLVERKHFDRDKGTVRFERRNAAGGLETKTVEAPPDTLAIEGLAGVLRFLPLNETRAFSAHVLSNEPRVYDVTFESRGKERIKVPAGEFECYKLEMVPHLGVLNVFRPLFPKTFFWFTVSAPHDWIRYEGPESGPGTPNILMELSHGNP